MEEVLDKKIQYPFTITTFIVTLTLAKIFFQVDVKSNEWLFFAVFLLCEYMAFLSVKTMVDYFVLENIQVKKSRLRMYETMESAKPYSLQIESTITKKRNNEICEAILLILANDKRNENVRNISHIKTHIENQTILQVIKTSSISRKDKRLCRRYIKKYNNNTADFVELKIDYETKELLTNNVDIKAMMEFTIGVVFGSLGLISINKFVIFLHSKIIGIIIMILTMTVRFIEQYRNQKADYLNYYSGKNSMVKEIIENIKQENDRTIS